MAETDLFTVGRVNFDLYAQQVGVPFAEVTGWDSMVGGSPSNAALAAARLGVRAGLVSGVGDDFVGGAVLRDLGQAGVDTTFVTRKEGHHTSLALRAQLPPDHPLDFFRDDPADIHVSVGDVAEVPVERSRAVLLSADAFARGPMVLAALSLLRRARTGQPTVYLDLDLRAVNWSGTKSYADTVSFVIDDVDVVLGTEEEFAALAGGDVSVSPAEFCAGLVRDRDLTIALKQGQAGVTVLTPTTRLRLPAIPVEEVSTVGAGDSFAAGLIVARLDEIGWDDAARFASACAAITVGRPGCSAGFPRRAEAEKLMARGTVGSRG